MKTVYAIGAFKSYKGRTWLYTFTHVVEGPPTLTPREVEEIARDLVQKNDYEDHSAGWNSDGEDDPEFFSAPATVLSTYVVVK